jgi:cyanate permease
MGNIAVGQSAGARDVITTLASSAAAAGLRRVGQIALALAGAVLLGIMLAINNISVSSAIQLNAEPRYRGRVNSLYNMIFRAGPHSASPCSADWRSSRMSACQRHGGDCAILPMLRITRQGRASPAASR